MPDKKPETENVFAKIALVTGDLAKIGIGKNQRNNSPGGNYNFRGIDDVYNALAPLLAKHRLCVLPRILDRSIVERRSAKGNALFYTTVEAEFDFVSADDGSSHAVKTYGEAMDSGDKGTNKAMSAAYKYAAFMTFCIPTEGEPDADAETHEVESQSMISDEDWTLIVQLVETTGTDVQKICKAYNVASLKELTDRQAQNAKARLQKTLADMAKQKEPA